MASTERMTIVPVVKAYPQPSSKYGESVCVAAVRIDIEPYAWVRLYPIDFRGLAAPKRFPKYTEITLDVLSSSDRRPESRRPLVDTISLGRSFGTAHSWAARRRLIEPLIDESMCAIRRRREAVGQSLGAFRPHEVTDVVVESAKKWSPKQLAVLSQGRLFEEADRRLLENLPWSFKYRYRCNEPKCPTHTQSIIDWEIAEAYRDWSRKFGGAAAAQTRIRDKWLNTLCAADRDTVFFVGNQFKNPDGFLVLGVFWPPKQLSEPQLF